MPKVSIIVPVYNAEKYIHKCLDSIISQTLESWEAILVNDGSLDNSGDICDNYAKKDKRFKVIHQENGGVSVARQTGLNNATGEFIIHCDPDDWTEPTMLELLTTIAIKEEADIVICDYSEETDSGSFYKSQNIITPVTSKKLQAMIINHKLHGSCCNKLIRKAKCENIKFQPKELTCYEDELFIIRLLNTDIKVAYIKEALYHYRVNINSSLTHSANKRIDSRIIEIKELETIIDIEKYDNLFLTKETLLRDAFLNKRLKELTTLYCDIHNRITKDPIKYRFFTPLGFFFHMALKGMPQIAYHLYRLNISIINLIQIIRFKKSEK